MIILTMDCIKEEAVFASDLLTIIVYTLVVKNGEGYGIRTCKQLCNGMFVFHLEQYHIGIHPPECVQKFAKMQNDYWHFGW